MRCVRIGNFRIAPDGRLKLDKSVNIDKKIIIYKMFQCGTNFNIKPKYFTETFMINNPINVNKMKEIATHLL